MVIIKCAQCGKNFDRKQIIASTKNNFCGHKCMGLWRSKNIKGNNHPLFNRTKINCNYCKKELERAPSLIHKPNFCNKTCHDNWQKGFNNRTKEKSKMTKCEMCGKECYKKPNHIKRTKNTFCSKKCFGLWERDKLEVVCAQCNKKFERIPAKIKRVKNNFCSKECHHKWNIGKLNMAQSETKKRLFAEGKLKSWNDGLPAEQQPNWVDGRSFWPYDSKFNDAFKKYIFERDNYTCQLCGTHQEYLDLVGIILEPHHIDRNPKNSIPQNVLILCRRCHGLTRRKDQRKYWMTFFQSMLADEYGYKYTEDQKIILEYNEVR